MNSIEQYQKLLESSFSRAFEVLATSTENIIHFGTVAYDGANIVVTKTVEQITAELEKAAHPVTKTRKSKTVEDSTDE